MKRVINTFILAIIGVIFAFDSFAYALHNDSISEQITLWINASSQNFWVFIAIVIMICTHFIFGKYKD